MTLEASTSRVQYATNGTTGPFAVPFYFLANTHLQVVYTPATGISETLTLTTHYSVSGAANPAGGSVTTVTAYPSGGTITIVRSVPLTQLTDYEDGDRFPADSHETALDKLTMIDQQQQETLNRAFVLPVASSGVSTQLPLPAANLFLAWNPTANALVNVPSPVGTAVRWIDSVVWASDYATLQLAIDAAVVGGRTVIITQDISTASTVVLKRGVNLEFWNDSKILWTGSTSGIVLETDPADVIRNNRIYGLHIDVGAAFAGQALRIHSAVGLYFDELRFIMSGSTSKVIVITADSTGGEGGGYNRNSGSHFFGPVQVEGQYGTMLETSGVAVGYDGNPQVVTLNTFAHLFGLDGQGIGINLKSWTDSNVWSGINRLGIEANGAIGLQHGDGSPGVYNNIFLSLQVDNFNASTGRICVKVGAQSKLLKIVALYNSPEADGGVVVADNGAISYDITHMRDPATASTGEMVRYQRKIRIAGEGFNGSAPVVMGDDTIATYNMAEGGAQENSYAIFSVTASDPESSCLVWVNPRRTSGGPQIKLLAPPAASCEVAVGTGALTAGTGDGVDTKFNIHVTTSGTVIFKNRRGADVAVVYAPLGWFQGD